MAARIDSEARAERYQRFVEALKESPHSVGDLSGATRWLLDHRPGMPGVSGRSYESLRTDLARLVKSFG